MNLSKKKIKRKIVATKILENRGKSVSKAMKEAGYSDSYSKNPQQFTSTKSWEELMKEFIPDDVDAQVHKELLTATHLDHYVFSSNEKDKDIEDLFKRVGIKLVKIVPAKTWKRAYFMIPDNLAKDRALDKSYKLKGRYAPEKLDLNRRPLGNLSEEELDELEAELVQQRKRYEGEDKD